ncbi:COA8 family protein CG14806, mitochondrial [Schistocerca americana]|uniref:COA8 family protein CG14806, mitochondrial n=1 Tax=Schistocerca americana TaxID=7009 RepID=UPI001F4F4035|nr:COA8 family protein CG14806, mitochondrial [Schistocerca americana]XP_049959953.1 COA8 family protein CG14806, mitochondrial [Schistocerca serialis cubense]
MTRVLGGISQTVNVCNTIPFLVRCLSRDIKPAVKNIKNDLIGPPNQLSNLRPIVFHIPENESAIEKKFRLEREETQKWNEAFWATHNKRFFKERDEYITANSDQKVPLTADEMSVFYKSFLDEHWKIHMRYNAEWYRRNVSLLFLAIRVKLHKIRKILKFSKP